PSPCQAESDPLQSSAFRPVTTRSTVEWALRLTQYLRYANRLIDHPGEEVNLRTITSSLRKQPAIGEAAVDERTLRRRQIFVQRVSSDEQAIAPLCPRFKCNKAAISVYPATPPGPS